MFKLLPESTCNGRRVAGRGGDALLFELGKLLVGIYLGRAGIGSAYGAAGSLIVVLSGSTTRHRFSFSAPSSRRSMRDVNAARR
jgi:hypothetical protein